MSQPQDLWDTAPRRFYRREWTRNKPHLPKSISLPIFKLLPIDRPIFTCKGCGFINTFIPLCLWCCWTSDEAHREFEEATPRARRASAPPKFSWELKAILKSPYDLYPVSTTIKQAVVTPQSSLGSINDLRLSSNVTTTIRRIPNLDFAGYHMTYAHDNFSHASASEATTIVPLQVANATALATTSSHSKSRRAGWLNESPRKDGTAGTTPQQPSLYLPRLRHSVSAGVDRHRSMHLFKTISMKSLRSTHIVIDIPTFHETYDLELKSDDNNHPAKSSLPASKTLRRKKRISLFRTSTPITLRPSSSLSTISSEEPVKATRSNTVIGSHENSNNNTTYKPNMSTHTRTRSQPVNNLVRLGHPSRPYYSAIRPNMTQFSSPADEPYSHVTAQQSVASRPLRPLSLPSPIRAPSPHIYSVLSSTSALSEEEEPALPGFTYRPRSSSAGGYHQPRPLARGPTLHHRSGFSLSGETELRMALAEQRNWNVRDIYKFKDMGKGHTGGKVLKKVREIKKGLKGLVAAGKS